MSNYYNKLGIAIFDDPSEGVLVRPFDSYGKRNDNIGSIIKVDLKKHWQTPIGVTFVDNVDIEIHLIGRKLNDEICDGDFNYQQCSIIEANKGVPLVDCIIHSPQVDKLTEGAGVTATIETPLLVKIVGEYNVIEGVIQGKFRLGLEPDKLKYQIITGVISQTGILPPACAKAIDIYDKMWKFDKSSTSFIVGCNYVMPTEDPLIDYTYLGVLRQVPLDIVSGYLIKYSPYITLEPLSRGESLSLYDVDVFVKLSALCSMTDLPTVLSSVVGNLVSSINTMAILVHPRGVSSKLRMAYLGKSGLYNSIVGLDLNDTVKKIALDKVNPNDRNISLYQQAAGENTIKLLMEDEGVTYASLVIDRISGGTGKQLNFRYHKLWEVIGTPGYNKQVNPFNEES